MKLNFKLLLEYDGTSFHGWQRQPKDITIQQVIEDALLKITREKTVVYGCGRTDSGVHALNYVANFRSQTHHGPDVFIKALNSILPDDIVIKDCSLVPEDFHARKSAKSKIYEYHISNAPTPPAICRRYVWHVRKPLDFPAMKQAAAAFIGKHDFSSFEGVGSPKFTSVRTILQSSLHEVDKHIVFTVEANGFLRYMVRNLVGTLVYVGAGKYKASDMKSILEACDRGRAGPTAPPLGLFLTIVKY